MEEFRSTLDINLVGTFTTIKYAVPHLRRRGGSVIVTSSVNGTRIFSNSGASAYSSSKAGQVALAKMLAVELGPDKIRVNVICPGGISTEIADNTNVENDDVKIPVEYPEGNIPLTGGKPGSAEQVGELIAFLASDEASHISGTEIWIDGAIPASGLTCARFGRSRLRPPTGTPPAGVRMSQAEPVRSGMPAFHVAVETAAKVLGVVSSTTRRSLR